MMVCLLSYGELGLLVFLGSDLETLVLLQEKPPRDFHPLMPWVALLSKNAERSPLAHGPPKL